MATETGRLFEEKIKELQNDYLAQVLRARVLSYAGLLCHIFCGRCSSVRCCLLEHLCLPVGCS